MKKIVGAIVALTMTAMPALAQKGLSEKQRVLLENSSLGETVIYCDSTGAPSRYDYKGSERYNRRPRSD
jgi:hypothetical protein